MKNLIVKLRKDVLAIVYLAIALFLILSFLSFNPLDPSFNSIGTKTGVVHNFCGYFGSFLADVFYQSFGFTSWIFVGFALLAGVASLKGEEFRWNQLPWFSASALLLTISSLFGLYAPNTKFYQNQIGLGGVVGVVISKGLVSVFNIVGTSILLWAAALVLTVALLQKSLKEIFSMPIEASKKVKGFAALALLVKNLTHKKMESRGEKNELNEKNQESTKQDAKVIEASTRFPLGVAKNAKNSDEQLEWEDIDAVNDPVSFNEDFTELDEALDRPVNSKVRIENTPRKTTVVKKVARKVENWELPPLSLLKDPPPTRIKIDEKELKKKAATLQEKLSQFNVKGTVEAVRPGPAVTMFEFKPNADVRVARIVELQDDLKMAMSAESMRIMAPIPGRDVVGIETSNTSRETIYLKEILQDESFWPEEKALPLAIGKQANGEPKVVDLRRMPHLLVAGTTGSGKSVFVVSTITGLLFKHSPKSLRLILVDPKQVDLAVFGDLPHLLMPIITDPRKASSALRWVVNEMEKRNRSMAKFSARKIEEFNKKVETLTGEQVAEHETAVTELESDPKKKQHSYYFTPQPFIVVVVEEFGDVMAVDGGGVEASVVRIAQMARACGIHLILAMQSPRKEVVTGLIKTNIPGRISFKVNSAVDSRIILDETGAERLLSQGDMLFLAPGVPGGPQRHHGPWLPDDEIVSAAKYWSEQGEADFSTTAMKYIEGSGGPLAGADFDGEGSEYAPGEYAPDQEEGYDLFLDFVSTQKTVSASMLQRKFRIGYPKAARLIEIFEQEGVVGPAQGSKPRQVLVYKESGA